MRPFTFADVLDASDEEKTRVYAHDERVKTNGAERREQSGITLANAPDRTIAGRGTLRVSPLLP